MDTERIRIFFERQKEQILDDVRIKIQKHEFQADSERRSIQELQGIIDTQQREIDQTITGCEQSRRDQSLHQEQLSEQNRDLRKTRTKSLHEIEESEENSRATNRWIMMKRLTDMKRSCREYTLPRSDESPHVRG